MEELKKQDEPILRVKDLELYFKSDYGTTQILNKVSFEIHAGETLGIVGESGCGKSMTAMSIMRLLKSPPAQNRGEIMFEGMDLLKQNVKTMRTIRGNKISMIFQDPMTSLNPVLTVGFQLSEVFRLHQGMSKKQAEEASIEALRMVHVALPDKRVKDYPYQLSGGMRQRVMIAMALACKPQLLIADEPTTALDVTIQAQVLDLMRQLNRETGTAIMFITHDLGVVSEMCERAVVLYCGEVMEEGYTEDILLHPLHPYTEGLMKALPQTGERGKKLFVIPGMVPPAGKFPSGCVFAPRCPYATEACSAAKPPLSITEDGRKVRCFRYGKEENHGEQ